MKKLLILFIIVILGLSAYSLLKPGSSTDNTGPEQTGSFNPDPSSATFKIENEAVTLSHGVKESDQGEISILPERASGDLNSDGKNDTAVLLADNSAGSGVFIYIAAYVSGPVSYKGTNAVFIGDRVSPESVSIANGIVTLKYLDRKPDEPFAAEPTVLTTKQFVYKSGEFVEK